VLDFASNIVGDIGLVRPGSRFFIRDTPNLIGSLDGLDTGNDVTVFNNSNVTGDLSTIAGARYVIVINVPNITGDVAVLRDSVSKGIRLIDNTNLTGDLSGAVASINFNLDNLPNVSADLSTIAAVNSITYKNMAIDPTPLQVETKLSQLVTSLVSNGIFDILPVVTIANGVNNPDYLTLISRGWAINGVN
jgi:hypothetical protein